jgi:hypothetical protein
MKKVTEKSIEMLGETGVDIITGIEGVITSVCFDLYGCVQAIITPLGMKEDGKPKDSSTWLDVNRIKIKTGDKIMLTPDFDRKYKDIQEIGGCDSTKPLK